MVSHIQPLGLARPGRGHVGGHQLIRRVWVGIRSGVGPGQAAHWPDSAYLCLPPQRVTQAQPEEVVHTARHYNHKGTRTTSSFRHFIYNSRKRTNTQLNNLAHLATPHPPPPTPPSPPTPTPTPTLQPALPRLPPRHHSLPLPLPRLPPTPLPPPPFLPPPSHHPPHPSLLLAPPPLHLHPPPNRFPAPLTPRPLRRRSPPPGSPPPRALRNAPRDGPPRGVGRHVRGGRGGG